MTHIMKIDEYYGNKTYTLCFTSKDKDALVNFLNEYGFGDLNISECNTRDEFCEFEANKLYTSLTNCKKDALQLYNKIKRTQDNFMLRGNANTIRNGLGFSFGEIHIYTGTM